MTNLVLLEDSHATALAHDGHEVAVVKLMRAQEQFIVGQLVRAALIVALESNLVEVLLLQLVQLLKTGVVAALARCRIDLG